MIKISGDQIHGMENVQSGKDSASNDGPCPNSEKQVVEKFLASADVRINGDRPWDIHVHTPDLSGRSSFQKKGQAEGIKVHDHKNWPKVLTSP